MSEFKDLIEDAFYFKVGAAAKLVDRVKEDYDEFRDRGEKEVQKGRDLNEELKHTVDEFRDDESSEKKEKSLLDMLNDLTDEEKKKLKEALLDEGKED